MGVRIAHVYETRNAYRILDGKTEGKRPLQRFWCRWEGNIKMDLKQGVRVWNGYKILRIGRNDGFL